MNFYKFLYQFLLFISIISFHYENYADKDFDEILFENKGDCDKENEKCLPFIKNHFLNFSKNYSMEEKIKISNEFMKIKPFSKNKYFLNKTNYAGLGIFLDEKQIKKGDKLFEFNLNHLITSESINFKNFYNKGSDFFHKNKKIPNFDHSKEYLYPSNVINFSFNFLYYLSRIENYIFKEDLIALPTAKDLFNYPLFSLTNYELNIISNDPMRIDIINLRNMIKYSYDFFNEKIKEVFTQDEFTNFFRRDEISLEEFAYAIYILFTRCHAALTHTGSKN